MQPTIRTMHPEGALARELSLRRGHSDVVSVGEKPAKLGAHTGISKSIRLRVHAVISNDGEKTPTR